MLIITTPTEIESQKIAWEGILEPTGEAYRGTDVPRVTLAEPKSWSLDEAMKSKTGEEWVAPDDKKRYKLVRLAFMLHELENTSSRYTEATLRAFLKPLSEVVAHDLYPQRVSAEGSKKSAALELGPSLKFSETVSLSGPKAGVKIEFQTIYPVVQAFGLGESSPYWTYKDSKRNQLLGSLSVYLVIEAPKDAERVDLDIELEAAMENRFGFGMFSSGLSADADLRRHTITL